MKIGQREVFGQTNERTNERTACIWVFCAKFMHFWRFHSHGNIFFEFSIHFYAYIILIHYSVQRIYFKKNKILCWKWLKMLHFSIKPPFWGIRISLRPLITSRYELQFKQTAFNKALRTASESLRRSSFESMLVGFPILYFLIN